MIQGVGLRLFDLEFRVEGYFVRVQDYGLGLELRVEGFGSEAGKLYLSAQSGGRHIASNREEGGLML